MNLPVTFLLAAAFAVMMAVLSLRVSLRRREMRVVYGDGDDSYLKRAIRAHGNFIEYAPLLLALVLLLELGYQSAWLVGGAGAIFVICRILHAIGTLWGKDPILRAIAMMGQHTTSILVAGWLVKMAIFGN